MCPTRYIIILFTSGCSLRRRPDPEVRLQLWTGKNGDRRSEIADDQRSRNANDDIDDTIADVRMMLKTMIIKMRHSSAVMRTQLM